MKESASLTQFSSTQAISPQDAGEIQRMLRKIFKRKPTKQEIIQALKLTNVLFDAPLAAYKLGVFYIGLITESGQTFNIDFNSIRKQFYVANNSIGFGLFFAAIVLEYASLIKKGGIQQVVPRIREGSEKGLFVLQSLMQLSALVFSRIGTDASEPATIEKGVNVSLITISLLSSILFGALMLDKTRMPLTATVEDGSIIKSHKIRKALVYGRIFFTGAGVIDLLVENAYSWCAGGNFIPFWCQYNDNPLARYLASLTGGVIGTFLFALTQDNEKYFRRFLLSTLAITTVCWGNQFFADLGSMVEIYEDYDEAIALDEPIWPVVLSLTLPFFMAFVRIIQTQERFQNLSQIVPSMEIQLADLSNIGSKKDSPRLLPLLEVAADEMKNDCEPLSRNSSDHSDASTATPPRDSSLSRRQDYTGDPSISDEEASRLSVCTTPDRFLLQSEPRLGRVSQLGMYATSSATSGIQKLKSRATWISDTIWGSPKKDAAMPEALRENLLKEFEYV